MKIKEIIEKVEKEYKQEIANGAEICIVTFATADQTEISYHTDRHQDVCDTLTGVYRDARYDEAEWNILDIEYMDADDLNRTVYANHSESADKDEKWIYVFLIFVC
jgi:hypothetical protein